METTTRTVRFKKSELERIERFLKVNPLFDFSSLVRHAVEQFMLNPSVSIKALPKEKNSENRRSADV
jgi:hypothetical protein